MLNPLSSFILPVWSTKLVSSVKELELELLEDELLGLLLEVLELVVELELLLDVGLLLEEVDEGLLFDEELDEDVLLGLELEELLEEVGLLLDELYEGLLLDEELVKDCLELELKELSKLPGTLVDDELEKEELELLLEEELELLLEDVFRNAPCSAGAQPTTIETSSKIAEKIAIIFTFIFPSLY